MTEDQVRAVLGEPRNVEKEGEITCWHYLESPPLERNPVDANKWVVTRGSLLFSSKADGDPRLIEWKEP
jgi:hypothetical protein